MAFAMYLVMKMIQQIRNELKIATDYMTSLEDAAYLANTLVAVAISPVLLLTGFRFSKDYRWGTTKMHALVYKIVNTTAANRIAGL